MYALRRSFNIESDLEAGFTCWDTAETLHDLCKSTLMDATYIDALDMSVKELARENEEMSDEELAELLDEHGVEIVQRPDGRWGMFHHGGLAVVTFENEPATEEEAVREFETGRFDQFPVNGSRTEGDVKMVQALRDGWYLLECENVASVL